LSLNPFAPAPGLRAGDGIAVVARTNRCEETKTMLSLTFRRRSPATPARRFATWLRAERLEDRAVPAGWAFGLGSRYSDHGAAVAVDPVTNDVYVAGTFYNGKPSAAVDFDPGPGTAALSAVGGSDHYLAKYTADGQFAWARRIGAGGNEVSYPSIEVDGAGNVYFAGTAAGSNGGIAGVGGVTTGLGAVSLSGPPVKDSTAESAVVVRFTPDGQVAWYRQFVGTTADSTSTRDVAVSPADGSVLVTGTFTNTADFDTTTAYPDNQDRLSAAVAGDGYVAKLTAAGTFAWVRRGAVDHVASDAGGNVYLTGRFSGTTNLGTIALTSPSGQSSLVARMDAAGNYLWARRMGGPLTGSALFGGIAVFRDPATTTDAVYVGGNFSSNSTYPRAADFGDPANPGDVGAVTLASAGGYDGFVSRLDSAGNFLWTRQLGGADNDYVKDLAVDAGGAVYTTGHFQGAVDFDQGPGPFTLTSIGGIDAFVWELDAGGNLGSARRMGGALDDTGLAIAVDGAGAVYTAGDFNGAADFATDTGTGTVSLTSKGGNDAFVVKTVLGGSALKAAGSAATAQPPAPAAVATADDSLVWLTAVGPRRRRPGLLADWLAAAAVDGS
jgi:hypothetical protein